MPPVLRAWVTYSTDKKHVDMNAQHTHITFVSFISFIPTQEKSCLEARKPKLV